MTTRTLQILLALSEGPTHGFGVRRRVENRTDGRVRLGSGTLYEAVHRLVEQGTIEEVPTPSDEPSSGGPPRRFYALTSDGRADLAEELGRMREIVRYAEGHQLIPDR